LQVAESPESVLALYQGTASQAAEKHNSEGDGGFNPRVKPLESVVALAMEGRFSLILPGIRGFSAACSAVPQVRKKNLALAAEGMYVDENQF
jgi:hypothetical protein